MKLIRTHIIITGLFTLFFYTPEMKGQSSQESENNSTEIFTIVEKMPVFTGGNEELFEYLKKNINYPKKAKKNKVEGVVYVTFVVNEIGKIENCKLLRGIGYGCDKEAIRVVKAMPAWTPGTQRGKPVKVQYNLPLKFILGKD